jgi:CheY-like chemotaxis protein
MKSILIADDDAALLVILAEAFCLNGHWCNVLTARSGAEALDILKAMPVDLVLTDLDMPDMDGFELLSQMRTRHSAVPVLVMTGAASKHTEERLRELGVSHYVTKPLNLRHLANEVTDRLASVWAPAVITMSESSRGTGRSATKDSR